MTHVELTGSCLCGAVSYAISGDALAFNHCHCKRCRKATGTGHASNILLRPTAVEWIQGESVLSNYKVPDAERFATVFCSRCGSLMPRLSPDGRIAVVPAGSLDNDPGVVPERRIFAGSAVSWSCSNDELPVFDGYPPTH